MTDRTFYCWLWDGECQDYTEISIDKDGRLFGFPNSKYDGTLAEEVLLLRAIYPEQETKDAT